MQYDSLTPPNFWDRSGFLGSEYHQKILSCNKALAACI